jgi:hypothetical protein
MVLDVPREVLPHVEQAIASLSDSLGFEVVDAIAVSASEGHAPAVITVGPELAAAATGEALPAAVAAGASSELGQGPGAPEGSEAPSGALFGAESQAAGLGDELAEVARRLRGSHAALLVVFRHTWREQLVSLLGSNTAEILVDRWLEDDALEPERAEGSVPEEVPGEAPRRAIRGPRGRPSPGSPAGPLRAVRRGRPRGP